MTVEELAAKVEALEKEREALQKKVDGLDSLNGKRGTEIGEVRKQLEDISALKDAIKSLTEDRDAVKKELEALKSKAPVGGKDTPPPDKKLSDKELADKLESELTDAEKKDVEDLFNKLPDADKKAFVDDDTFRVAVLKQAKAGNGEVNPNGPWRVKKPVAPPSGEELERRVKELFKTHRAGGPLIEQRGGGYGERKPAQDPIKPKKFI
jgi:chromosome segregation ATPase